MHLGVGRNEVDLAGISDETSASVTGDLANPAADLNVRATVRDVRQDGLPDIRSETSPSRCRHSAIRMASSTSPT